MIHSLSLFPAAPTLEEKASVKSFVSLQFLNPRIVCKTPWAGDQAFVRSLPTCIYRTRQTQNKCRQISMLWVVFEPTFPVLERAIIFHPLDRVATVIGSLRLGYSKLWHCLALWVDIKIWAKQTALFFKVKVCRFRKCLCYKSKYQQMWKWDPRTRITEETRCQPIGRNGLNSALTWAHWFTVKVVSGNAREKEFSEDTGLYSGREVQLCDEQAEPTTIWITAKMKTSKAKKIYV
jgi:hypothetical protein